MLHGQTAVDPGYKSAQIGLNDIRLSKSDSILEDRKCSVEVSQQNIMQLLECLDANKTRISELVLLLESNIDAILRPSAPIDTVKGNEYSSDSYIGSRLCKANYDLELIKDYLIQILDRVTI